MNLKINGKKFDFFNSFQLMLKFDCVASAFSFNVHFNPDNPDTKMLMKPGQYYVAEVMHENELLIKGYVISHSFSQEPVKKLASLGGYSLTGLLEDCSIPVSLYPLQSDGLNLKQIAEKLLRPFDLKIEVDSEVSADMSKTYDSTNAKESQTVKEYLSQLASMRNVIISHTPDGKLLFTRAKTKQNPILNFSGEMLPGTSLSLSFNGQAMHSEITVMKESDGGNSGESTVSNPFIKKFKSKTAKQTSGDDNDTSDAAKMALAEQLKNIVLTVSTDRWTVNGKILRPGNIISVTSSELYLYKKTEWFIESISFSGDNTKTTASLTCVLPSVYDGSTPKNIFE